MADFLNDMSEADHALGEVQRGFSNPPGLPGNSPDESLGARPRRARSVPSSSSCVCEFCGYSHAGAGRSGDCGGTPDSRRTGGRRGAGDGDGGATSGGGGGGRGGRGGGGGGDGGSSSGGDTSGGDGGGSSMNADDPQVCPYPSDMVLFIGTVTFLCCCAFAIFFCQGEPSFTECFGLAGSCPVNENMKNMLQAGTKNRTGSKGLSSNGLPSRLQKPYKQFKRDLQSSHCRKDGNANCPGLVNYIDTMAGGTIFGTGQTKSIQNPLLCKCKDKGKSSSSFCLPKDGQCKNCVCETLGVETILKDEPLRLGYCWAFAGTGEVYIGLFFPIYVWGFTVRHPSVGMLPPGYAFSAPKDIELMGIGAKDNRTHSFGNYVYELGKGSTQIFEVENPSEEKFSQVKFRFTSNHGNPNYTAVYKLELHGYLDENRDTKE